MELSNLNTNEMIQHIRIGEVAQLLFARNTPSHFLLPEFQNAYCVQKDSSGKIRWLQGDQSVLNPSTSFIANEAKWKIKKV